MSIREIIDHDSARALRIGKYNKGLNTTTMAWRIGDTLIDSGPSNQWPSLKSFVIQEGVKKVLLTHHHEDHAGNGANILSELHLPIFAEEKAAACIRKGHSLKPYQKIVWGPSTPFQPQILISPFDAGGGHTLTPIAAPGHSDDLTCFLDKERGWLFAGDLYIADRLIYLRADENLSEMLQTLGKIKKLDFKTLFCAHRGVVEDGPAALGRKHAYLLELQENAKSLHSQGLSLRQITRNLLGKEDFTSFATGFHFCKKNLIKACLTNPAP
ncbi:MAG: MBL fold metallo-hydrolase [Desulfobacterales bacterium]|nr:MBL fold metallo-hydrolase [Desulfobacterales bacterium]